MAAGATYEPIATTTLSSAQASITFSSISSSYTDIRVVVTGAGAASNAYWGFRFNSDASALYSTTYLSGNGTAASSSRITGYTSGFIGGFTSDIGTTITMGTLDIFSYAGSTNKTALATYAGDRNGSGYVERAVNLWRSTSAINSITIRTDTATNFAIGTTATLYGIKAA